MMAHMVIEHKSKDQKLVQSHYLNLLVYKIGIKDGDGIPDTMDIDGGDGTGEGAPGTEGSPSADELRSRINKPTVKRKRNPLFAIEDYPNTAGGNIYKKGSNAIYQYNRIKNDITEARDNKQAEKDLKTIDTIADNTFGVMYDMNFNVVWEN